MLRSPNYEAATAVGIAAASLAAMLPDLMGLDEILEDNGDTIAEILAALSTAADNLLS